MTRRCALLVLLLLSLLGVAACGSSGSPATTPTTTASRPLGVSASGVIAFRRYLDAAKTTSAIFTMKPDGTGERQVSKPPKGRDDTQPAISADGTQVAWEYCQNGDDPSCHVLVAGIDGSGVHELKVSCPHGPICDPQGPAWSPDGRLAIELAWGDTRNEEVEHSQLVVLGADGSDPHVVVDPSRYRREVEAPVWSPDGTQLAFEDRSITASGNPLDTAVAVVAVAGGAPHRITPPSLVAGDHPDWSPDGVWISFLSHEEEVGGTSQVEVVHPDGTGRREVTHVDSNEPPASMSFSPDSTWLVYGIQTDAEQKADLFVTKVAGGDTHRLTRTALYESAPEWGTGS